MRTIAIGLVILLAGCAASNPTGRGVNDYTLAILLSGARASELDETAVAKASAGHRAHIEKLGAEGTLLLAAPFGEPRAHESWRGIYVLDSIDIDQAHELVKADPSIVAGLFELKLMPWRSDVDLRPMRAELERGKAAGAPFVPAAYVMAIGELGGRARDALRLREGNGQIICAGELGGEREGQVLLLLTAETVEEARAWLESGALDAHWELSSLWATDLLGDLAEGD